MLRSGLSLSDDVPEGHWKSVVIVIETYGDSTSHSGPGERRLGGLFPIFLDPDPMAG